MILAAARGEFGQHGFAGGRVDRIARRAGVNKQLIFYYFGSKRGLYRSVLEAASSAIAEAASAPDDRHTTPEKLRLIAAQVFNSVTANGDLVRTSLLGGDPDEKAGEVVVEPLERLGATVRQLVSEGQGLGYVRDDVDPDVIARLILATAVGCLALEGPPATELRDAAIDLVTRALAW
jgi:TetR/AcrR family transcriptional regulator